MKAIEYKIVVDSKVDDYLSRGYELYGNPFFQPETEDEYAIIFQAMVKYEDKYNDKWHGELKV